MFAKVIAYCFLIQLLISFLGQNFDGQNWMQMVWGISKIVPKYYFLRYLSYGLCCLKHTLMGQQFKTFAFISAVSSKPVYGIPLQSVSN